MDNQFAREPEAECDGGLIVECAVNRIYQASEYLAVLSIRVCCTTVDAESITLFRGHDM